MVATTMQQAYKSSSRIATDVLSLPTRYGKLYEDFIVSNASSITSIENALRSLTYIVPGRFRDAEIASESLHSGVQLLSLYHDSLLARAVARLPKAKQPIPSPHNRYTRYWTGISSSYKRISTLLQVIQYTELLCEMAAKRRGERARWRMVTLLEMLKAICRLLLLRLTDSRPLINPPVPEREVDPSTLEEDDTKQGDELVELKAPEHTQDPSKWVMPRTGLALPVLPLASDIPHYLQSKVLTADDIKPAKSLLHRVSGYGELAEVMFILRPVIYALLAAHAARKQGYGRTARSPWYPWVIGLVMEYGARQLAKQDHVTNRPGGLLRGLTVLEKDEMKKRGWNLVWWVMRGPFFETYTRTWIQGVAGSLRGKPLLDMVGGIIEDYEFLWDQYYFPTATM